jgi:dUTP pyrophosphatase
MSSNFLENYVIKITEPFDYTLDSLHKNEEVSIVVELMQEEHLHPKIPENAEGDQHLNFGLDLFSAVRTVSQELNPYYHYAIIRTGIKIQLPYGYHMLIGSRSGLGFKRHIQAFPGVIDHSYRGEIMVKLYSPASFSLAAGDKIAQGLILRSSSYVIAPGIVELNTARGSNGFGSTDK